MGQIIMCRADVHDKSALTDKSAVHRIAVGTTEGETMRPPGRGLRIRASAPG